MNGFIKKVGRAINALCRKTYWYNQVLFPDCTKFWNHNTFNLDVVNLGSTSGVYAFNYKEIDLKCANWALSHNPLAGDESILRNYMSYLNPKGSTVIFSLCPFSSLAGSYECLEDKYYTLLYSSSIPHYSKARQVKVMHMRNRPLKYYPVYEALRDLGRLLFSPFNRPFNKILTEDQMRKDAERWINGWKLEFSVKSFDAPLSIINMDAINDARDIINRLIIFCRERSITPFFVIPPVYHTLGEYFTEKARVQLIDSMINDLGGGEVSFLNYLDDPAFNRNPELFINSFYLNKEGAIKFTKRVLTDIGLVGKI